MNEYISSNEIKYTMRRLAAKLRRGMEQFPVTVLTGARQVGKSTLLQHEFPEFTYRPSMTTLSGSRHAWTRNRFGPIPTA